MKEKIYKVMKTYGWNLGSNTYDDFNSIYDLHFNRIDNWYNGLAKKDYDFDMKDINKQDFSDMIAFMSDFLRALNEVERESNNDSNKKNL